MTFRLRKPLQVMTGESSGPSFVEIMPGSIITVEGDGRTGQIEVRYNGQIFLAVVSDILERADVVEDE